MGTKNDIKWFEKILKRQSKVMVTEISELYRNKGTNRYYRAYVEVQKANIKQKTESVLGNSIVNRQGRVDFQKCVG